MLVTLGSIYISMRIIIILMILLVIASSIVIADVLSESVPHVLVLLIPTWRPLRHTLTHIMVVCAVTALNLSLIACAISWIDLLVGSVFILFGVGFRISRLVWGRCNLEADVVVNLRELELF